MAAATSLIPLDNNPRQLADDNSLLQIDRELDALLEQIEDEVEEQGEASTVIEASLAKFGMGNRYIDTVYELSLG